MGNGNVALQADTGNSISGSKIHFFVDNSEKMILDDGGRLGLSVASATQLGNSKMLTCLLYTSPSPRDS